MADNWKSGRTGTATINGNEVALINWNINSTVDIVMFKNSRSGRFPKREGTFFDATVSFSVDYDFDAGIFESPISVVSGAILTNVKLFLTGGTSGTKFHLFPLLLVQGTPQSLQIDGKIATSVNCVIDGTYSLAGGITPS